MLAAAMMSTQAIAIDAMLPAFPVIVARAARRQRESRPMDRHRLHGGPGLRPALLGADVGPFRPAADIDRRPQRSTCSRRCCAVSPAASMRCSPGGSFTGSSAASAVVTRSVDPRPVFGTADGAGHVPDLHGVPHGAHPRAELGAADAAGRAVALHIHRCAASSPPWCGRGRARGCPKPCTRNTA